ncbi:MAG: RHS repeat domain-containing protein, partial [Tumebacillaceae bacterium]
EHIVGDPNTVKYVVQTVPGGGLAGTPLFVTAWSLGNGVPATGGYWGVRVEFTNSDGTTSTVNVPFDRTRTGVWQEASSMVSAPKDFTQVAAKLSFENMPTSATAYFDSVTLDPENTTSSSISHYNYVDNSSFEYDVDSTGWPDGWYRTSGGTPVSDWVDIQKANGNVYTGTHALHVKNPTSWESVIRRDEKVPYDSSKTYMAIGYIKTLNLSSQALVVINCYDTAGNYIGEVDSNEVTGSSDWTRVTSVINSSNAPVNTSYIEVSATTRAGTGEAYFDNIRLQNGEFRYTLGYDTNQNYMTSVTDPMGNQSSLTVEASTGNLQSLTNARGKTYSYGYDLMDRVNSFTYPSQGSVNGSVTNKTVTYTYDPMGDLTDVKDPSGNTWKHYTYNELGHLKSYEEDVTLNGTQWPNTTRLTYNPMGSVSSITLPGGQVTKSTYDLAGRLTGLTFQNGTNAPSKSYVYTFDLNDNLTGYGKTGSMYAVTYDKMDHATKVTEPTTTNFFTSTYDAEGLRTNMTATNGSNVWSHDYTYDDAGRPRSIVDKQFGSAFYLYDEADKIVKTWNSSGTAVFNEYDNAERVTQVRTEKNGAVLDKWRYDYDTGGNITKIWSDIDSTWVEYTYDATSQLVLEKSSDGTTKEYQYDELGNRTAILLNGTATNYTYNAEKNRLVSVGSRNYSYDPNGNVTGDGVYTYTYGDDNRLASVAQSGTTVASYTYDALGNRDTLTSGGVTKTFHYDEDRVSYVTDSAGNIYRFGYSHAGRPQYMVYQGAIYWYLTDQHGNVVRMVDSSGSTVAQYKYDAFGNVTGLKNTTIENLNPYRYTGYWYDTDTKKYWLKVRYYDPEIGRFL